VGASRKQEVRSFHSLALGAYLNIKPVASLLVRSKGSTKFETHAHLAPTHSPTAPSHLASVSLSPPYPGREGQRPEGLRKWVRTPCELN
jgi:hypothetical protein